MLYKRREETITESGHGKRLRETSARDCPNKKKTNKKQIKR